MKLRHQIFSDDSIYATGSTLLTKLQIEGETGSVAVHVVFE